MPRLTVASIGSILTFDWPIGINGTLIGNDIWRIDWSRVHLRYHKTDGFVLSHVEHMITDRLV